MLTTAVVFNQCESMKRLPSRELPDVQTVRRYVHGAERANSALLTAYQMGPQWWLAGHAPKRWYEGLQERHQSHCPGHSAGAQLAAPPSGLLTQLQIACALQPQRTQHYAACRRPAILRSALARCRLPAQRCISQQGTECARDLANIIAMCSCCWRIVSLTAALQGHVPYSRCLAGRACTWHHRLRSMQDPPRDWLATELSQAALHLKCGRPEARRQAGGRWL